MLPTLPVVIHVVIRKPASVNSARAVDAHHKHKLEINGRGSPRTNVQGMANYLGHESWNVQPRMLASLKGWGARYLVVH